MKKLPLIAAFVTLLFTQISNAANSQLANELAQLQDQHTKAIAAAAEPVNRLYKSSLEQLLRRATQASDFEAALTIKKEIDSLNSPAQNTATATTPVTPAGAPGGSKIALKQQLSNTKWSVELAQDAQKPFGWVVLNADNTTQSGWHDRKGTWEIVSSNQIRVHANKDPNLFADFIVNTAGTEAEVTQSDGKKFTSKRITQ